MKRAQSSSDSDSESKPTDPNIFKKKFRKRDLKNAKSPEEIVERRRCLKLILEEYRRQLKDFTIPMLVSELHLEGWKADRSSIYRDRKAIQKSNAWVQNLAESTYSERQEDIDNIVIYTIKEAKKNYEKDWIITKAIKRTTPKGAVVEAHTSSEIPGAKKMFLDVMQKGAELQMKHTNGENINRSAAMLGIELDEAHNKINSLKEKLLEKGMKESELDKIFAD